MPINPTSKPLHTEIGRHKVTLHFDLNTFCAFEEATGKFFLDFLTSLQTVVMEAASTAASITAPMDSQEAQIAQGQAAFNMLRKIGMIEIRALIWAGWHEYPNANDEAVWPYTLHQVGAMLDAASMVRLLPLLLQHSITNMVGADKDKDKQQRPTTGAGKEQSHAPSQKMNGGDESGASDEQILSSLTPRSGVSPSLDSQLSASIKSRKKPHAHS